MPIASPRSTFCPRPLVPFALSCFVVFLVTGALTGCAQPDAGDIAGKAGDTSVVKSALVDNGDASTYTANCLANHVPTPPKWGQDVIGPAGSGKTWTDQSSYTDSFVLGSANGSFNGHAYFWRSTTSSAPGLCVLNAHAGLAFDIICQGDNGKACFWEGNQSQTPPTTAVQVVDFNWSKYPNTAVSKAVGCTSCHVGQNAFITHASASHPLNLTAQAGWMPAQPYDPITTTAFQNLPSETFTGYPTSKYACLGCHSGTVSSNASLNGGKFPSIAAVKQGGYQWCDILASVTNKPTSKGGMPQSIGECTPDLNCAAQTDPFVAKMLATCGFDPARVKYTLPADSFVSAHSDANSPVALNTYDAASYPAWYDHIASIASNGIDVVEFQLSDNQFTSSARQGWKNLSSPPSSAWPQTEQQLSVWAKEGTTTYGNVAIALTGVDGTVWVQEIGVALRNATQGLPTSSLAAGAPSAYVRNDLLNAITYRGKDSLIHELKWDGVAWGHSILAGQTLPAGGDPVAFNASGTNRVIYKCGDKLICELRMVPNSGGDLWKFFEIATTASLKGSFMPAAGGADTSLYYVGTDGLHELFDLGVSSSPTANYTDLLVAPDANIASAPSAYLRTDNSTGVVYLSISGTTSKVVEASISPDTGSWGTQTRYSTTGALLKHDPFGRQLMYEYTNSILFRGPNEELFELLDNGATAWTKSTVYGTPKPPVAAFFSCGGPIPAKTYWDPITVNGNDPSGAPTRDLGSIQDKFCYVSEIKQYDGHVNGTGSNGEEVALAYNSDWLLGGWGNAPSGESEITANCIPWTSLISPYAGSSLSQSWTGPVADGATSTTAVPGGSPATNACMIGGVSGSFSMSQVGSILLQGLKGDKTKPTNLVLKNQTPSVFVGCLDTNLEYRSPIVTAATRAKSFTWTNNNSGVDGRMQAKDTGLTSSDSICYLTGWNDTHNFGCSAGGCGGSLVDGAGIWVADGSAAFKTSSGSVIKAGRWVVYGTGSTKTVTASCQSVPF